MLMKCPKCTQTVKKDTDGTLVCLNSHNVKLVKPLPA